MGIVEEYIMSLKDYLSGLDEFSKTKIIFSFPNEVKSHPIKNDYISIGLEKIDYITSVTDNFLGCKNSKALFGKNIKFVMDLSIFTPIFSHSNRNVKILDAVIKAMSLWDETAVIKISTTGVKADRNSASFMLEAKVEVKTNIVSKEKTGVIQMNVRGVEDE